MVGNGFCPRQLVAFSASASHWEQKWESREWAESELEHLAFARNKPWTPCLPKCKGQPQIEVRSKKFCPMTTDWKVQIDMVDTLFKKRSKMRQQHAGKRPSLRQMDWKDLWKANLRMIHSWYPPRLHSHEQCWNKPYPTNLFINGRVDI